MKDKFKVGDLVKCVFGSCWSKSDLVGRVGIVKTIRHDLSGEILDYGVEFEPDFDGHNLCGDIKGKNGWYCFGNMLEIVKNETIVIYRKGNDVIAYDKTNNKKAVARCNPEDTFDFETGARLAFERLFGEKKAIEKTPLNAKIIFTKGDDRFKTGHIYKIENGKMYVDNHYYPISDRLYSIDGVEEYFRGVEERKILDNTVFPHWSNRTLKFIEVKED